MGFASCIGPWWGAADTDEFQDVSAGSRACGAKHQHRTTPRTPRAAGASLARPTDRPTERAPSRLPNHRRAGRSRNSQSVRPRRKLRDKCGTRAELWSVARAADHSPRSHFRHRQRRPPPKLPLRGPRRLEPPQRSIQAPCCQSAMAGVCLLRQPVWIRPTHSPPTASRPRQQLRVLGTDHQSVGRCAVREPSPERRASNQCRYLSRRPSDSKGSFCKIFKPKTWSAD